MRDLLTLRNRHEFEIEPWPPYSLEMTIDKPRYGHWLTPFEHHDKDTHWSAAWLLGRVPIGIKVQSVGNVEKPRLAFTLYSHDKLASATLSSAKDSVCRWLAAFEDVAGFYRMGESFPALRLAIRDLYGFRDTHFPDLFSGLMLAFTLQNTRWARALTMLHSLYENFGRAVSFDGHSVGLPPRPSDIIRVKAQILCKRCKLGYRAKYLKCAAQSVRTGFPDMQKLKEMPPDQARSTLLALEGVGDYSADIVTPHPSFPADSWSAPIFCEAFAIKLPGARKDVVSAVKSWAAKTFGNWQGHVYAYILHDLENIAARFDLRWKL